MAQIRTEIMLCFIFCSCYGLFIIYVIVYFCVIYYCNGLVFTHCRVYYIYKDGNLRFPLILFVSVNIKKGFILFHRQKRWWILKIVFQIAPSFKYIYFSMHILSNFKANKTFRVFFTVLLTGGWCAEADF